MSLPVVKYPLFVIEQPSTKAKLNFRPYLVKEEKILLMAKQGGAESEMLSAIKQVVQACCVDKGFKANELTLFDLEDIFIKLRSRSVNSVTEVSYRDEEDEKEYKFIIKLEDIVVRWPEVDVSKIIEINSKMGIVMKYPTASLYSDVDFMKSGDDAFFQLIIRSIESIYDGDKVFVAKDHTFAEIGTFLENLDPTVFEKVRLFLQNQPRIYYKLEYKNSLDKDKMIELTTLADFFTFR